MTILNIVGIPLTLIYIASMFIFPLFSENLSWQYVQNVWDRWQGLNIGMLAFISSIIAFNISRYNANKQRERDFSAAKAFLPQSLSELCEYFNSCAALLQEAWQATEENRLEAVELELPESYKEIFSNCIRYAESDVGNYLSIMLVNLQVNRSRLTTMNKDNTDLNKPYLISCLYRLGELQAMANKLFPFARGTEDFDSTPLEWKDFRNVYSIWFTGYEDFTVGENMSLEDFTKRRINKANEKIT